MILPEKLDQLQRGWSNLVQPWGADFDAIYRTFDRLVAAYTEPWRHYHTLEHIAEVLKVAGRLAKHHAEPVIANLAIWFHDAVYDPKRSDNEAKSAEFADGELASLGVPIDIRNRVAELILYTDHRAEPPPDDATAAVLLDADLAILGAGESRYRRYAEAIRREYDWVPADVYAVERTKVLQGFLQRPAIYRTESMRAEGEAAARANLTGEIGRLAESHGHG